MPADAKAVKKVDKLAALMAASMDETPVAESAAWLVLLKVAMKVSH